MHSPMKYISQNLLENEEIVFQWSVHPFYATLYFTILFFGLPLVIYYIFHPVRIELFFGIFHPVYVVLLCWGIFLTGLSIIRFLQLINMEIVLSNKRVLYKTGFISRNVFELPLDKVESVKIDQSIFQRIIWAGTLIVSGIGWHSKPIKYLCEPMNMRNELYKYLK